MNTQNSSLWTRKMREKKCTAKTNDDKLWEWWQIWKRSFLFSFCLWFFEIFYFHFSTHFSCCGGVVFQTFNWKQNKFCCALAHIFIIIWLSICFLCHSGIFCMASMVMHLLTIIFIQSNCKISSFPSIA